MQLERERISAGRAALLRRSAERALGEALVGALFLGLAAASAWVILAHPKPAVWDQARLLESRFEAPHHPAPPYGMTAQLAVIAIRSVAPSEGPALHEWVRLAAMLFYAGAAAALAARWLASRALLAAFLAFLFASQYPLIWLSSELFAGGLLCLALLAAFAGWPRPLVGVLLALLALAKMELVLVAAALLVVWLPQQGSRREALGLAGAFAAGLMLLLLPGLALHGPGYLTSYGQADRGFATFAQHFAALVAPFQLAADAPNPWLHPEPYLAKVFPGARSLGDVVAQPGLAYLDFVALSAARGVRKAGWVLNWAALAVPILAVARRRAGLAVDAREKAMLASFVGVLPFVLLSYPHIRYFARYYPLFLLLVLGSVERLARAPDPRLRGLALGPVAGCLAASLACLGHRAAAALAALPRLEPYWFSD
jgi:hypothetical protein